MSVAKSAAAHIDWTKLSTSLGLKTETVAALSAFRKRNEEARRVLTDLKEQKTSVDFAHYRKVLKNQAVVDEVEKAFQSFKPTSYDVQAQIKSIDAVEAKAVCLYISHSFSSTILPHSNTTDTIIPYTSIPVHSLPFVATNPMHYNGIHETNLQEERMDDRHCSWTINHHDNIQAQGGRKQIGDLFIPSTLHFMQPEPRHS